MRIDTLRGNAPARARTRSIGRRGGHAKAVCGHLFWALLLAASPLRAEQARIPMAFHPDFLRQLLIDQVYTDAGQTARVWDDGKGCNSLVLANPRVAAENGRLRITSDGAARVGTAAGGHCLTLMEWRGSLEVIEEPVIGAAGDALEFKIVDSHLVDAAGEQRSAAGKLWDWVKTYVHPRLAAFRVDLKPTLQQIRELVPTLFPGENRAPAEALVRSLTLTGAAVEEERLVVVLAFELPQEAVPAPTRAEAPLTPSELEQWSANLDQWDAFLTESVMQAAADSELAEIRFELLAVLLDARSRIAMLLSEPATGGREPVRELFTETWDRLATLLRSVSASLPPRSALRYLTFVSAGDAVGAIDALAPQLGLELSTDGLRRMARMLSPEIDLDALRYRQEVDPRLRRLFQFGPPLPVPDEPPPAEQSWWWPLRSAWAGGKAERERANRLNRWIPTTSELPDYLRMVRDLLDQSAADTLHGGRLDSDHQGLFRDLVLATAWQESCWRQFIRQGKKIKPMMSSSGSVGIMQINQRVWRGFYELQALRSDIGYNAKAGSEILLHYLVDYALKKNEHRETGRVDNLARATYAMYNGGPSHMRRYRKKGTTASLKKIDSAFWKKYRSVQSGNDLAVAECFGLSQPVASRPTKPRQKAPSAGPGKPAAPQQRGSSGPAKPSKASPGFLRDAWVLKQDPRDYTIQLLSAQSEQAVVAFLQAKQLGPQAGYYRFTREGQTWFAAFYGRFATRLQAENEAKALQRRLPGESPWLRSLGDLQQLLRAGRKG